MNTYYLKNQNISYEQTHMFGGPIGTRSGITSKSGFFGSLECNEELKRFLRHNAGGICIKIHLNPMIRISVSLLEVWQVQRGIREKNLQKAYSVSDIITTQKVIVTYREFARLEAKW